MTKPPATKQMFLRRMLRRVEARGEEVLGIARVDRELGDPNWHLLRRLTALDPAPGLSRYVSRLSGSVLGALPSGEDVQRATALQMNRTAMVREKRGRLLLAIRQTYQVRGPGSADLGCRVRVHRLQMNCTAMVREKRGRLLLAIRQTYQVRAVGYFADCICWPLCQCRQAAVVDHAEAGTC